MRRIHVDFETTSTLNLSKTGAYVYCRDCHYTKILSAAYCIDGGPVMSCHVGDPQWAVFLDKMLIEMSQPDTTMHAWNANFERLVIAGVLSRMFSINPDLWDPGRWRCTMAAGAYWGLPLSLEDAAIAAGTGFQKDMEGRKLMLKLSKPRAAARNPTGHSTWWHEDEPDLLDKLVPYNVRDVETERAVFSSIPELPDDEQAIWEMDQRANDFGVKIDRQLVEHMADAVDARMQVLKTDMATATGGRVTSPNQAVALVKWLNTQVPHLKIKSVAKPTLEKLLSPETRALLPRDVERALEIRQEAAKSSNAKLAAMETWAGNDDRVRGMFQYYGASRTGRWAGRGPQPQNFPRPTMSNEDALAAMRVIRQDSNAAHLFYDKPLDVISSCLRGCFTVERGNYFCAIDFSQIEARVLAFISGQKDVTQTFEKDEDVYKKSAQGIYGLPRPDDVSQDQRQVGKVAVLACGFQGGKVALQHMAEVYGLDLPDGLAKTIVDNWRSANPKIVNFWYELDYFVRRAIKNPDMVVSYCSTAWPYTLYFKLRMWRGHLVIRMPSGRDLIYREAELTQNDEAFHRDGTDITYMGINQYTRKWERIKSYGGKFAENITQALARDIMAQAMMKLHHEQPYPLTVLGSVHDEVLLELDGRVRSNDQDKVLTELTNVVCHSLAYPPNQQDWARGMPIKADGYISDRFGK